MNVPLPLVGPRDLQAARDLIGAEQLHFEPDYDDLIGRFDGGRLIGCGARLGRVLKMLVVHPEHRGGNVLADLVTELMRRGGGQAVGGYFVFTKPCAIASFERLNFRLLAQHPTRRYGLLENRAGLHQFLRDQAPLVRTGNNGAVVINADPFSRGHLHLIEAAAAAVEHLYVFVPGEGGYTFAAPARQELARRGVSHLRNVSVLGCGPYVLCDATFPGYFLAPGESREAIRLALDLELFAGHLAPYFHIRTRFIGAEPLDPAARAHHAAMGRALAAHDIQLVEIDRARAGDQWINTAQIRRALFAGELERVRAFVPPATYDYLLTIPRTAVFAAAGRATTPEEPHAPHPR